MTVDDLGKALSTALYQDAIQGERGSDNTIVLGRLARGLPTEVVDKAFAFALPTAIDQTKPDKEVLNEVLVLAQQFVDRAGADRFSIQTRLALKAILGPKGIVELPSSHARRVMAIGRAHALSLARSVGITLANEQLARERTLKRLQPLLWLDLVSENIAAPKFVEIIRDDLTRGSYHPFALLPRLKAIVEHQRVGVAQQVLNEACFEFFRQGRFSEAYNLIKRANVVEPRDWSMPMGEPLVPILGVRTPQDLLELFKQNLLSPEMTPMRVIETVENFRPALDPVLAFVDDEREEARRKDARLLLFRDIRASPNFIALQVTGILPNFRHPDCLGVDWWQEFGPWRESLPSIRVRFEELARQSLQHTTVAPSTAASTGGSYFLARRTRVLRHRSSKLGQGRTYRLLRAAAAAGFSPIAGAR